MAELTIDPAAISSALEEFVESYKPSDTPTRKWVMWPRPAMALRMWRDCLVAWPTSC